jgi:hypothetical protein
VSTADAVADAVPVCHNHGLGHCVADADAVARRVPLVHGHADADARDDRHADADADGVPLRVADSLPLRLADALADPFTDAADGSLLCDGRDTARTRLLRWASGRLRDDALRIGRGGRGRDGLGCRRRSSFLQLFFLG